MTAFSQGLDLVIEQLTAQKRLLHRDASAAPALLQNLSQTQNAKPQTPQSQSPQRQVPQAPTSDAFGSKVVRMDALRARALVCTKCPNLVASRTQVVFGLGNLDARLMFVGEAPGEDEDLQGEPFVGKAGQLLTKMIGAMGLQREDVYIANVLKCRPDMPPGETGNRKPKTDEMATCLPWLLEQIDIVQPEVIVGLGAVAAEGLIGETRPMRELRAQWLQFQQTPLLITYHPAYLLRNQATSEKRKVWEDLLMAMEKLRLPISEKQRNFFTK